jgi:beta-ribofuranosylaminobenzene 5'-phosphate synthase
VTARVVHVEAPSRLHFGMLSFGQPDVRQFGGAGAMIDQPGVRLSIAVADRFSAEGPLCGRVVEFVEQARRRAAWLPRELRCRIKVESAPRPHIGLGSGTQLGMAVAIALNEFFEGPLRTAVEFARVVGRGRRSAIGVHGALAGGLLVEAGKYADEISPLISRVELPSAWRFVLLTPKGEQGLSGAAEEGAFDRLPAVPLATSADLSRTLLLELLPAAVEGDFERFSDSVYHFGRVAGECFAAQQGGAFAGPRLFRLIERLRASGIRGVGQTSWGPTLFALTSSMAEAECLVGRLRDDESAFEVEWTIAAPSVCGTRRM